MDQNTSSVIPPVAAFLDSCLWDKGIRDVSKDLRDQMISDLSERLQDWLMQAVFMKLEEKDVPGMDELMDRGAGQEEIMQFLQERVPNINKVFEDAMVEFKDAYVNS